MARDALTRSTRAKHWVLEVSSRAHIIPKYVLLLPLSRMQYLMIGVLKVRPSPDTFQAVPRAERRSLCILLHLHHHDRDTNDVPQHTRVADRAALPVRRAAERVPNRGPSDDTPAVARPRRAASPVCGYNRVRRAVRDWHGNRACALVGFTHVPRPFRRSKPNLNCALRLGVLRGVQPSQLPRFSSGAALKTRCRPPPRIHGTSGRCLRPTWKAPCDTFSC